MWAARTPSKPSLNARPRKALLDQRSGSRLLSPPYLFISPSKRGHHGTHPVSPYCPVRLHSSVKERDEESIRGFARRASRDRSLRFTKDVPVVRGDHGVVKAILPGVWRVAASSLAGTSAAEAAKAEYDRARC